uniref:Uncharacterized protein n=1 Tax=Echinococcus granulosus TaxID=6210 RepID=U6FTX3_ECHGR|nr:hypothetical protein EgrG_002061500 [Echinococcus granulosus]
MPLPHPSHHCLDVSPPPARLRYVHAHTVHLPTHAPPQRIPIHQLHLSLYPSPVIFTSLCNNSCHLLTSPSVVPPPTTAPLLPSSLMCASSSPGPQTSAPTTDNAPFHKQPHFVMT